MSSTLTGPIECDVIKMEKDNVSFVRLDNANLLKMTLRDLAKNLSIYSQLMIDVQNIFEEKEKLKENFSTKLDEIEKGFNDFEKLIPEKEFRDIKKTKVVAPPKPKKKEVVKEPEVGKEIKTLMQLKNEFERIKNQLREIRSS